MDIRRSTPFAICLAIFISLSSRTIDANSGDQRINIDERSKLNLDDLVIEVTAPLGRERILNAEPFYERWQNVDDVTYWESIYGSADNIPEFDDLPDIAGETVELKYVAESENESSSSDDNKTSDIDGTELRTEKKIPSNREPDDSNDRKDLSSDRCERINPLWPSRRSSIRRNREIEKSESDDLKRVVRRELSLLRVESDRSRPKFGLDCNRGSFDEHERNHYRPYEFGHRSSSSCDRPSNDRTLGRTESVSFVDSAINAESLNANSERCNVGRVVAETVGNAAGQLTQAKRDAIDLGAGRRAIVGFGSVNNAETDATGKGVSDGEVRSDDGFDNVGNSVLDTDSGIINEYAESVGGVESSVDSGTEDDGVDAAVGTVVNDEVDDVELVGENLEEEENGEVATDSEVSVESNAKLDAEEDLQEARIVSDEDDSRSGKNNDVDGLELVGSNSEATEEGVTETPSNADEEGPSAAKDEKISDGEKSGGEETVGSTLTINSNDDADDSHHDEDSSHDYSSEDLSCECSRSSEDDHCYPHEFYSRIFYPERPSLGHRYHEESEENPEYEQEPSPVYRHRLSTGIHASGNTQPDPATHLGAALSSVLSESHANTGIQTSLEEDVTANTDALVGHSSAVNVGASRFSVRDENHRIYDDRTVEVTSSEYDEYDDGEPKFGRSFPGNPRADESFSYRAIKSGIHASGNTQPNSATHLGAALSSVLSEPHANTGIQTSLEEDVTANTDALVGQSSAVNVGASRFSVRDENHRIYDDRTVEVESSEYDEYDDGEPKFGRSFPGNPRADESFSYRAIKSGIHASGNTQPDPATHLGAALSSILSEPHANTGIQTSLEEDVTANTDALVGHSSAVNVGASRFSVRDENHRIYDDRTVEVTSSEYDEHDDGEPEFGRSFPGNPRADESFSYRAIKSGIHASGNTQPDPATHLGAALSSILSEPHANTGIQTSLEEDVTANTDALVGHSSAVNVGASRFSVRDENHRIYDDRTVEVTSSEYDEHDDGEPKFGRSLPGNPRADESFSYRAIKSGIHASGNTQPDPATHLGAALSSILSEPHANTGIQTSLEEDVTANTDTLVGHSGAVNVGASRFSVRDENHRIYDDRTVEVTSSEYDEYDDGEPEFGRSFPGNPRADESFSYRAIKSGIHGDSGVRRSFDTEYEINSAGAVDGVRAKSHQSLDIWPAKLRVNGANPQRFRDAINSAARANGEIHGFHDSGLDVNGQSRTGVEFSTELDSHLDTETGANRESTRKLGEKICAAACEGISDLDRPDSRSDEAYDGRPGSSEVEAAYHMCDNCRREVFGGSCPMCGKLDDGPVEKRRRFSSAGTIYHFDGPIQDSAVAEMTRATRQLDHSINLDANCTGETANHSLDCPDMDHDLQTPRDGNPVPLRFVRAHLSHGHDIAVDMHDRARSLVAGGLRPSEHTASMLSFFQSRVSDDLVKLNEESEITLFGTKLLQHKLSVDYNVTPNTFLEFLDNHGFRVTGERICQGRRKRCGGHDKFRSLDGSCNNFDNHTWGQRNRAFARILPARYSDGIHGMPVSVTGAELPNPRKLSVRLYSRRSNLDPELSLAVVQWGQTLAHDLARQVMDQTTKGGIECCGENGKRQLPRSLQHHSCAPISISPRDEFYSRHGQRCMNFVRSMTVAREDCTLGPADQLNGATSFLDCSPMYGVDKATSDELREFTGGRMKVEYRSGRWMLPTMRNRSNVCDIWTSDDLCYRSGDPRNNQNPQLVILQTLLVREHNRIADGLSALNNHWTDERIFQESRRIVIAEYQHITYNEWLPLVLGKRYAKRHGIVRKKPGMSRAYNELVNPSTIIGFTSGAFRSLHSMIEGEIGLCNVEGDFVENIRLSDHYFRPRIIEKDNNFEDLLRGLTAQRMQKQNMHLHTELTEYLFRSRNDYGMDLAAIDIQRGRDHGVPGYNAYRKICRLRPARDFDDLSEEISWENIEKLRRDYAHVDDIDLVVGATMENRISGSQFGPTNRCIIGEQFYRSRMGDRYFYDNEGFSHSFTPEQFDEITKVTLSRLMCDMGGAVDVIQRYAFRAKSSKNPLVPCRDLPKLDLKFWIE